MEPGGVALLAGACAVAVCLPGAPEAGATALTWPSTGQACVVIVEAGDSLSLIADGIPDPAVTAGSLQAENGIDDADVIEEGDALDVCVGNGINDVTGGAHQPDGVAADATGVEAQQRKLNELFSGLGIPELAVDGDSGPLTRQQLCAARLALDLPISRADMAPGSDEEKVLMAATALPIPANAAAGEDRWILVDKTCQVLFAGETGTRLTFVFGTSTGEAGWETSNQEAARAFRYDPALENAGWHNSTKFPVAADNPLNGNMYRPLYFYRGQAIHGSNNVPPEPRSKGCARLRVEDQDTLIGWLGLTDATGPIWNRDRIDVTVTVQGDFVPDAEGRWGTFGPERHDGRSREGHWPSPR